MHPSQTDRFRAPPVPRALPTKTPAQRDAGAKRASGPSVDVAQPLRIAGRTPQHVRLAELWAA